MNPSPAKATLALSLAVQCAVLAALLLGLLLYSFLSEGDLARLESPRLLRLRAELRERPEDEALKAAIRQEDAALRARYFQGRRLRADGARVLAAALGAALLAAAWRRSILRGLREPVLPDIAAAVRPRRPGPALAGLACLGVLLAAGLGLSAALGPPALAPAAPAGPVFAAVWPAFRGPGGQGHAPEGAYPRSWNLATGENLLWRVEAGLPGQSSPILWGDRLFLTGGDAARRQVAAFQRATGRLLWTVPVRTPPEVKLEVDGAPLEVYEATGYAAPTPAADESRVFALFATGDLAGITHAGRLVWLRNLGVPDSIYSFSSSLVLHAGRLLVQYDQGEDGEAGLSRLLALDPSTGATLWERPRPVGGSWSSPALFATPSGPQLVTCANPWVISYHPETGEELWRAEVLHGDVAPSPVQAGNLVFVTNDMACLAAIDASGRGDVTATHVRWKAEQGLPDIASPLTDGTYVLQADARGTLTCFEAATGKLLWTHEADEGFQASPSLAGGLVYLPDSAGRTLVFRLGERFELLHANDLGEPISACPAFGDGRIYIRGKKHLFCIGER